MLKTHKSHHLKVKLFKLILHLFSFMDSFCVCGKHMEQCWKYSKCLFLSSHALTPRRLCFTVFYEENKRCGKISLTNVKNL